MDRLKPFTKEWELRQRRNRHNGYLGYARMMQMQAIQIASADTTNNAAKAMAAQILGLAELLEAALKERVD